MKQYLSKEQTAALVQAFGGPSATSRVFGVTPAAVSAWVRRKDGKGIEFRYLQLLRLPEYKSFRQIPAVQAILKEVKIQ